MSEVELLEIINESGDVLRVAPRSEVHGNPELLHRVVHVLVFNSEGELYLQKRSMQKDVAPGKWDTSVGGHVDPGESLEQAAMREMSEELGISPTLRYLYSYTHSNDYETEQVHTYDCVYDGEVTFNVDEIDEVRAWGMGDVKDAIGSGLLSDNFEHEVGIYLKRSSGS